MEAVAENPRERIGGNNAPPETALDRAKPAFADLGAFLKDFPVIANDEEIRKAKAAYDTAVSSLKSMEEERKATVAPLNKKLKEINASYHQWHNADKKNGLYDKLVGQLWKRMNAYALEVERKRQAEAETARLAAEEAARIAREAEQREIEAATDAAAGVCDVDIAAATEEANEAFSDYRRADWRAQRAEAAASKVRITGGSGNAVSLQDHETLTVTDWRAAIEEMGLTRDIADAILKSARAYRKLTDALPTGVEATFERGL